MENYLPQPLDRTFSALGDPTRRAILARLEQHDGLTVGALAAPLSIKLPTVMKHLNVLAAAGLVRRSKQGRTVTITLASDPLKDAMAWLSCYEHFWSRSLDRLTLYAETREAEAQAQEKGAPEKGAPGNIGPENIAPENGARETGE